MTRVTTSLALLITVSTSDAVRAFDIPRLGIFRKKIDPADEKDKDKTTAKVKQAVETLRSDPDAKKRLAAAEELRDYDPRNHADIVPTLMTALKQDPATAVRSQVADSIGRLKPVTQAAGVALEQTFIGDPSEPVRKAAQDALWQYHLNGYRSSGANPAQPQTAEPPLAKAKPVSVPAQPVSRPVVPISVPAPVAKGGVYPQTVEPPLAKPRTIPTAEVVVPPVPSLTVPSLPAPAAVPAIPIPMVPAAPSGAPPVSIPPPPQ